MLTMFSAVLFDVDILTLRSRFVDPGVLGPPWNNDFKGPQPLTNLSECATIVQDGDR